MTTATLAEHRETFPCFGSQCTVIVADARAAQAAHAVGLARRRLLDWHHQFSRFEAGSELSRLNADPRPTVPVSPMLRRLVDAAIGAARQTGGLVDPTLAAEIERAGYASHFDESAGLPLGLALGLAPGRAPARPNPSARWREVSTDRRAAAVIRPPSVRLDLGGIAKGVFADELAATLGAFAAFAIDCAGDLRLGGSAAVPRQVHVESPFDGCALHTFEPAAGALATSGIGRRSWLDERGRPAHHLLDPASGRPAFTGVVQATALAPTAARAEALSKAALLSGPDVAIEILVAGGGVLVLDDGSHQVV